MPVHMSTAQAGMWGLGKSNAVRRVLYDHPATMTDADYLTRADKVPVITVSRDIIITCEDQSASCRDQKRLLACEQCVTATEA